ncbi:PocR ligand-binding domain-containing protein [Christensenella intestinihominis]|uniref:PocR ligand-binding domain-containing protein n=1 Tax=Christensenella intestinihominis TaxID=1851429 RepID=UPI0008324920|nr:PocR ligand-binding domain-containing protein [Christensenella intestinihominis]
MSLTLETENLRGFLQHFNTITGLRIALFDLDFNELLSCPEQPNPICARIKESDAGRERCRRCDLAAQLYIKEKPENNHIYFCHAGLVDGIAPITDERQIIGYMMIGQCLSCDVSIEDSWQNTVRLCSGFTDISDLRDQFFATPQLTHEQIRACAYLTNACASYVRLKNYVRLRQNDVFTTASKYIERNLPGDLSSDHLSASLLIPRNALFKAVKDETGMTLGQYILHRRLKYAKYLLKNTKCTIAQAAEKCGISDFNYFSRLFKKQYGVSPREYRKSPDMD